MTSRLKTGLLLVGTNVLAFALGGAAVLVGDARVDLTSPREDAENESKDTREEADRVVNVTRVCEAANGRTQTIELMGGCAAVPDIMKVNDHLEVTVRTSTGGSYKVSVPVTKKVRVGQEWP